jgi:hypothetical protein
VGFNVKGKVAVALIICSVLILLAPLISASEMKTIEGYIAFIALADDAAKGYDNTIKFNPPDGISEIVSMVVTLKGDFDPNTQLSLILNNRLCTPDLWKIPASAISPTEKAINYGITFDCTKNIKDFKGGEIPVNIKSGGRSENLIATYKLTYYNAPKPMEVDLSEKSQTFFNTIQLFGTEYTTGDNATVFLQLLDNYKQPINNALCYIDIYFPNKTIFKDNNFMMYLLGSDGLYFYDVLIPQQIGVYMLSAKCDFYHNITYSPPLQDSYVASGSPTSNYGNLTYMVAGRVLSSSQFYSFVKFNLTGITNVKNAILFLYDTSSFTAIINIKRVLSTWNETGINWNNKPSVGSQIYSTKSNAGFGWFNWNVTKLVKGWINGSFANNGLQLNYTNATGTWFFSSFYTKEYGLGYEPRLIITYNNSQSINEIRGSGELHVSPPITANVDLTKVYNNQTKIYNYLVAHNQSMWNKMVFLQNLMLQVNGSLWNKLFSIQGELANIQQDIISTNSSIHQHIDKIDFNTTELENLIKNTNLTIMTKLYGIQGELAQILDNQTIIKQMIYNSNQTIYDKLLELQGNLVYISNQITNTNQTLYGIIYGTNHTIMNKLYGIQGELADITDLIDISIDLIFDTNETIMTYLYSMNYSLWYDIYNIWNSLSYNLANITNISIKISANMTDLPRATYLYFETVEEQLVHNNDLCVANVHRKELLIEKCVAGNCFNITKNIDEVCPYGCVQGACLPTPTVKYSFFIIAILLMLGFMYMMYSIVRRV